MDIALQEQIHILWDELADMGVTRFDTVTEHLMRRLCELVIAQNVNWMGSVRMGNPTPNDPINGWRISAVYFLHPTKPLDAAVLEQLKKMRRGSVDETTIANVAHAGRFRANRLRDLVPETWFQSDYHRYYYQEVGFSDAIFIAFPVNEDAESWFSVFRNTGQPAFTIKERDTLAYALRGIKWFHRQLMLSHGLLIAKSPLTPSERRVMQHLLTSNTEKDIAQSLGLSPNSVHQYIVSIFRKFGVNSRPALISLWLGGNARTAPTD